MCGQQSMEVLFAKLFNQSTKDFTSESFQLFNGQVTVVVTMPTYHAHVQLGLKILAIMPPHTSQSYHRTLVQTCPKTKKGCQHRHDCAYHHFSLGRTAASTASAIWEELLPTVASTVMTVHITLLFSEKNPVCSTIHNSWCSVTVGITLHDHVFGLCDW